MSEKDKRKKPYLPDPKISFQVHSYFDYQIEKAQGQLDKLKHLKNIATFPNPSVDVIREAVEEADKVLKKETGAPGKLNDETLQLLTQKYREWMALLKFIQRTYNSFREQDMSKQEALDKLAEIPRFSDFSKRGLQDVVDANLRPFILKMLSDLSGIAVSTLDKKIRTTKSR